MFGRKKTPPLGKEDIPPGEKSATDEIVKLSLADMNIGRRPVQRGQHPKSHGCIQATFKVCPDIRDEYRHGLFKTAGSYDALLRFSNFSESDDSQSNTRGLAVKLFHNGEAIQDFVMIDHPVFFIRNAARLRNLHSRFHKISPIQDCEKIAILPQVGKTGSSS